MKHSTVVRAVLVGAACAWFIVPGFAQIGRRFPSEKKIVPDPVTGVPLEFLTTKPAGDSKIYQTHPQWTADGKWLVFRCQGEALAVNEESGDLVQLTESGFTGMLCVAQHSMKLYYMRSAATARSDRMPVDRDRVPPAAPAVPGRGPGGRGGRGAGQGAPGAAAGATPGAAANAGAATTGRGFGRPRGPSQMIELNLEKLFADSAAGKVQAASAYERVCGTTPDGVFADGNMGLDANEDFLYFRVSGDQLAKQLPPGTKIADTYGPRGMGAGPTGLASMNLKTGEVKPIVAVPFQIGHVQTNPWVPGEIVFCWETGGKAPQRTWTVMADGTGLRPLYPEAESEWITHEAVITKDEVAIAIMGHRKPGTKDDWGIAGTREHPTGLAIVNLRTREMRIAGQTHSGSGLWHVNGSANGRWAVGDDFSRSIYLIDRHTDEMILLSTGHKPSAADHPHPTFNADGTKIEIESAMLSPDGRSMNICVIPLPNSLLTRTYSDRLVP
jgi:oligogalacturonide lyase